MLREWEKKQPGRIESIFGALGNIAPSHLLDRQLHDFNALVPDAVSATFPIRLTK
jgi:tRNA 2-thiocytidine biosynthesis protein TtcA